MERRDDPDEMTPEAQLAEVAAIPAAGYVRLTTRASIENPLGSPASPMSAGWPYLMERQSVPAVG